MYLLLNCRGIGSYHNQGVVTCVFAWKCNDAVNLSHFIYPLMHYIERPAMCVRVYTQRCLECMHVRVTDAHVCVIVKTRATMDYVNTQLLQCDLALRGGHGHVGDKRML